MDYLLACKQNDNFRIPQIVILGEEEPQFFIILLCTYLSMEQISDRQNFKVLNEPAALCPQ
jgi:hypothetical protein